MLSLAMLTVFLIAFILFPRQRQPMLLSGLLLSPYAFSEVFYVPDYWNPQRVASFWASPEDLIFLFASGGVVWLLATWPVRRRLTLPVRSAQLCKRYVVCGVANVLLQLACLFFGWGALTSHVMGILGVGVALLWLCAELWPLAVAGAFGYALVYPALLGLAFVLWPEFRLQWNTANLWGPTLVGIPLEEAIWAASVGAVWPLSMGYVFAVRIAPEELCREAGRTCFRRMA
jgi:hypothetical protein